jgi:hypothetical protein
VRLKYSDPLGVDLVHEVFLTSAADAPIWLVPRSSSASDAYSYELTLLPKAADPIEVPARAGRGRHLFLLPPS